MVDQRDARRAKIVCTIGPASYSLEGLEGLMEAGMNVARLNFSHGTHESHREVYARLRAVEAKLGRPLAVMQDLQGPKIRLGKLQESYQLVEGDRLILSSKNDFLGTKERMPTTYPSIARDVNAGEAMLLADGRLELLVLETDGEEIHAEVKVGGTISSNKGINLPGTQTSTPALTEKDAADLEFGLALGVDYVALSFVRSPHDVELVRRRMADHGRQVPIISKIEKPEGVRRLEAIIDVSDGVMVARGDLGVELPPEQVPAIQRRCIRLARERGKIAVVATQMLMSMTENARPTHAEVSDVANAVFDGADAVMLSDETAMGKFPSRAVKTMSDLVHAAEEDAAGFAAVELVDVIERSHAGAICRAAVQTAREMKAEAIVSYTRGGLGPRLVADVRPRCLIVGCATNDAEVRRMAFYWGVRPVKIVAPTSVEGLVAAVENATLGQSILQRGDTVVITSKMPFTETQVTNMLKIHTLG